MDKILDLQRILRELSAYGGFCKAVGLRHSDKDWEIVQHNTSKVVQSQLQMTVI